MVLYKHCHHLTLWGRVTHICVSKLTTIGSDNGLSPGRRQANIWTNAGILSIGSLGTNFSEILIEIYTFSFKKMHLKMSFGKLRPFCLGLNVLISTLRFHISFLFQVKVTVINAVVWMLMICCFGTGTSAITVLTKTSSSFWKFSVFIDSLNFWHCCMFLCNTSFSVLKIMLYLQWICCCISKKKIFTSMLISISGSQEPKLQLIKGWSNLFPNSHSWHVIHPLTCRWMLNMELGFDHVGSGRGFVWTEGMKYHFYWQKFSTLRV